MSDKEQDTRFLHHQRDLIPRSSIDYGKALATKEGDLSYIDIRGPKTLVPGVRRFLDLLYCYQMIDRSGGPRATTNSEDELKTARQVMKGEISGIESTLTGLGYRWGVVAVNIKVIVDFKRKTSQ